MLSEDLLKLLREVIKAIEIHEEKATSKCFALNEIKMLIRDYLDINV